MIDVDLLVIGWGKAGKTLAGRWAKAGHTVALVERSPQMYGGTCINVACVPTKDLVTSAESRRDSDEPQQFFTTAVASRDELIGKLNAANHAMLADDPHIILIDGTARFVAEHTVEVTTATGTEQVTAKQIVIGTGTTPRRPEIPGIDSPRVYDSTTIQHADPFPARLAVVGAGFIGLEFASMFAAFGAQVILLNSAERILPSAEPEVASEVARTLTDRGVTILDKVRVDAIEESDNHVTVIAGGTRVEADAVLVATGRTPVTADLCLASAGIEVDERGFIVVDDQLRTSVKDIFAVGDVNGGPQFTYISLDDNRIVWDQLTGTGSRRRSDRVAVPNTTFITPPLSQVGLTEAQAREAGHQVLVACKPVAKIAAMPRPKILGETHGIIKFVVDATDRRILGATLFCTDSQELVNLVALAMRAGLTADVLRDGIWTHPSSTEALNEVLADLA